MNRAVEGIDVCWKEQENKTVHKFLNRWFWSICGGRELSGCFIKLTDRFSQNGQFSKLV